MADETNLQLKSALNTLISITDRSGNLYLEGHIFVNLKNSADEHIKKIALLESEVKNAKAELQENRIVYLSARVLPSMERIKSISTLRDTYL